MAVTVRLTGPLRKVCGGVSAFTAEGTTVAEVLAAAAKQYPELTARVFDDSGSVNKFVAIWAGGVNVAAEDGLDIPVSNGEEISLIPAVVGGSR